MTDNQRYLFTRKPSLIERAGAIFAGCFVFAGLLVAMLAYFDILTK